MFSTLPSLNAGYRPDLDVLTVRWLVDSDLPLLQREYAAVLRAAQHFGATRWLLDIRRREGIEPEAADWIVNSWLPQAADTLDPAHLRIAYFISATRDQLMRTSPILQPIVQEALVRIQSYELVLFRDEGEAIRWLTR